ncbi:bifunctional metallophosphatase/5'-nucleotidase [Cohnella soli]|uniref:Bifunctional metallophosphatase/5'-nucleotidase n=1 Tax=Cohnella soli TaxID=425005 RepID=A0ABW0I0F8_9BACL
MSNIRTIQLTVLATSDIHGHVLPVRYSDNAPVDSGLVKLATIVQEERKRSERVLFIDNGDLLQGTPFAYYHAMLDDETPHPIVDTMNALGLDVFVPGNHEFNYGLPFVRRTWQQSNYPWLSANVLDAGTGEPFFGVPYRIFEWEDGLRVAVLGLTTAYIPNWEQPGNIAGLRFESATEAAKRWVPIMREREGVHVVIVSYHGGFEKDIATGEAVEEQTGENEGWRLCQEIEGIDLLITGHQHRIIEGAKINRTWTVQPGYQGNGLARIELTIDDSAGEWRVADTCSDYLEAAGVDASMELVSRLSSCEARTQQWLDTPICEIRGDMRLIDHAAARLTEHPLIALINRIQMEATGARISCTSLFDNAATGFGMRVTMREITANYPYPNTLKVLRLRGQDILEALERTATYFAQARPGGLIEVSPAYLFPKPQHYNYDMWTGIEYAIDVSRPAGERVVYLRRDGEPLDLEAEFDVVMNHYRASGGGEYRMFRGKPIVRESTVDMTETIAEWLAGARIVEARTEGKWRVYS